MSKVFTEEFAQRLALLNNVGRTLRARGYRTVRETIWPQRDGHPIIEVEPGTARSLKPLIEMGHGRMAEAVQDGTRTGSIHYCGVRVVWREKRAEQSV